MSIHEDFAAIARATAKLIRQEKRHERFALLVCVLWFTMVWQRVADGRWIDAALLVALYLWVAWPRKVKP